MDFEFSDKTIDDILREINKRCQKAALAVANEVPALIKDKATLDEKDVEGNPIPHKQPRPKGHPTNNPNLQLIDTGDMYDNQRWVSEPLGENSAQCVYTPPDHYQWVILTRPWLLHDKINEEVRAQMEKALREYMEGKAPVPRFDGFEVAGPKVRKPRKPKAYRPQKGKVKAYLKDKGLQGRLGL